MCIELLKEIGLNKEYRSNSKPKSPDIQTNLTSLLLLNFLLLLTSLPSHMKKSIFAIAFHIPTLIYSFSFNK